MMPTLSNRSHEFFAPCPRNAEGLLLEELRSLGADDAVEARAGVAFSGPMSLAYRVCLWSRVASRVLLRLASFPLAGPDELYAAVRDLAWEDHLAVVGTLAVEATSTVSRGPLAHVNTHFIEQRVKDAVVDRFRDRFGSRPGVDLARPDIRINIHLAADETAVSLDLSGEGLHKRGYRLEAGEAPLRENLAVAILLRAGWPRIAAGGGTLLDPMCGSGTLLIEGAWLAGDVAPGLLRDYYGFLGWKGFDPAAWSALVEEARHRREEGLRSLPAVLGHDANPKAIGSIPRIVDRLVIRIGRNRAAAAPFTASILENPVAFLWLANSTMRIPFFVTSPISMICPIWLKMLIVWLKYQSERNAPATARGTVNMMMNGSRKLSN